MRLSLYDFVGPNEQENESTKDASEYSRVSDNTRGTAYILVSLICQSEHFQSLN